MRSLQVCPSSSLFTTRTLGQVTTAHPLWGKAMQRMDCTDSFYPVCLLEEREANMKLTSIFNVLVPYPLWLTFLIGRKGFAIITVRTGCFGENHLEILEMVSWRKTKICLILDISSQERNHLVWSRDIVGRVWILEPHNLGLRLSLCHLILICDWGQKKIIREKGCDGWKELAEVLTRNLWIHEQQTLLQWHNQIFNTSPS